MTKIGEDMFLIIPNSNFLKGQSNEIFDCQPGTLINGFEYFRFWLKFCQVFQTLVSKKLTRRGMIPRGD